MTLLQIMSKTGVSSVRVVGKTYCNLIRGCSRNFQRNLALISVLYSGERPDITPHDEELRKAKTTKIRQKETITMKIKLTKMIMSSLAVACALVCLAAAVALGPGTSATAGPAPDPHGCSVGMLRGSYLWTFDAYDNLDGNFVPVAVMQGLRFNGDGTTLNTFGTVNIGGTIIFDVTGAVGTYTVAPDCTGTLSPSPGVAPTFNIYVGPGAQQVWTIQSSPDGSGTPGVSRGTAVRVP
jgi:hypothetical protein